MTMAITAVASVAVAAVGVGVGAYEANKEQGIQNKELGLAATQQDKQNQSYNQLQDLISNPSSFFQSPVYQAAFGQGTQATMRTQQASGYMGSGNEAAALQAYGQSFGQSQLMGQEQLLAGMSGTGFNPAGALAGASNSNAQSFDQLGTMLAALGKTTSLGTGGGTTSAGGGSDAGGGAVGVGSFDGSMLDSSGSAGSSAFGDASMAAGWG